MKITKIPFLVLMLAGFGLASCDKDLSSVDENEVEKNEDKIKTYLSANNLSATRDSSGLYYVKQVTNPQGTKPNVGNEVSVYYQMYTLDGFLIDSTETSKQKPLKFPLGANMVLPGMERALILMRTGEKATVLLPYYLAFGNINYQNVPSYSPIRIEMQLAGVRTEAQQIAQYLKDKDLFVSETTSSGITIIRQNVVTGDTLGKGKQVTVNYVGKTLNGTQFDKGSFAFVTGTGAAVRGFDEGIRRMRKGEKAILIFPSSLGYGRQGAVNQQTGGYVIPPYAPLLFEVEVTQ
jgi:FKBP-type peptidyl-prolyl cis-trans isomerase